MGRYTSYQKQQQRVQRGQVHPVMRGIGCILLVLVPMLSYGIAVFLVNYGYRQGWPIPPGWFGTPDIHPFLWNLTGLRPVWAFIQAQTNLTANLIFAVAIAIVIFGVLSVIYGLIYKLAGPPQYGPTDEPPIRKKVKRYKR